MIFIGRCHICYSYDIDQITDIGDKFTDERVKICMNCGLIFLSPRMDDTELQEYYLSNEFSKEFRGEEERTQRRLEFLQNRAATRWNFVKEHFNEGDKFLEIGCSSGEFMYFASRKAKVYGVDPSTGYVNSIDTTKDWHGNFCGVRAGVFPEESYQDKVDEFDIVGVFHVLEHMPDPRQFLEDAADRLKVGGKFILEYPDAELASNRTSIMDTYFQRSHLYDFSGFNILNIMYEAGLSPQFAMGAGRAYPEDKNVIVVCIKKDRPIEKRLYDSERARSMKKRFDERLRKFKPPYVNLGRNPVVVHIGSHNINVGDGAISHGLRRSLLSMHEGTINFFAIDIVDYINPDLGPDMINHYKPDLVIVGGGGTIDGHKSRTKTGTALDLSKKDLLKVNAPIMFCGLGHNKFRDQEFFNADVLDSFILFCRDEGMPFSVRMDESKKRLSKIISQDALDYIESIPDPGFFIEGSNKTIPHVHPLADKYAVVQIAPDGIKNRLGDMSTDDFLKQIRQTIVNLVAEHKLFIVLALHTLDDAAIVPFVLKELPQHFVRSNIMITGVYHPLYAIDFFSIYEKADLVVGMRGHSIICPTGMGTPVIALSTHDKVEGYMRELGIDDWMVNPSMELAEEVTQMAGELVSEPRLQLIKTHAKVGPWKNKFYRYMSKGFELINDSV
jgi:polysaccharide pyruvyl transferase WcaK-like protein/SAM-dependent methyltransferase